MSWTPAKQVLDLTPIADNLLGYFEAQQAGALSWAGASGEFQKFYTNSGGRLQTMFPSLMILTQECEVDLSGDILKGEYQLVLEGTVSGPDTDELVLESKKYALAVESMLMNIPTAIMAASTDITGMALTEQATVFDMVRGLVKVSGFVQVFQIRSKFVFIAEAF